MINRTEFDTYMAYIETIRPEIKADWTQWLDTVSHWVEAKQADPTSLAVETLTFCSVAGSVESSAVRYDSMSPEEILSFLSI